MVLVLPYNLLLLPVYSIKVPRSSDKCHNLFRVNWRCFLEYLPGDGRPGCGLTAYLPPRCEGAFCLYRGDTKRYTTGYSISWCRPRHRCCQPDRERPARFPEWPQPEPRPAPCCPGKPRPSSGPWPRCILPQETRLQALLKYL